MFTFSTELSNRLKAYYRERATAFSAESNDQQIIIKDGQLLADAIEELKAAGLYRITEPGQWSLPVVELALDGRGIATPWHRPVRVNRYIPSARGGDNIVVWTQSDLEWLKHKAIYDDGVAQLVERLLDSNLTVHELESVRDEIYRLWDVMTARAKVFANDKLLMAHFEALKSSARLQIGQIDFKIAIM